MKLLLIIILVLFSSLNVFAKQKSAEAIRDQLELQEDIQRFYTRFTERIIEASYHNNTLMEEHRVSSIREYLLYDSEALKIVTGPFPTVNLLDMLVFIKLNKAVVKKYWVPKVYGKSGKALNTAFKKSEDDIDQIALKIIPPSQLMAIDQVVDDWEKENPDQIRVEKVRLADFSKYALKGGKSGKSFSLSNLIINTESTVEAVDQMVLVANRALFLSQHLPLIVRLHARLGTQEILGDTIHTLQSSPGTAGEMQEIPPLVQDLTELAKQSKFIAKDVKGALALVHKNFPNGINVHKSLHQIDSIVSKSEGIITKVKKDRRSLDIIKAEFREALGILGLFIIFISIVISAAWWTGYYISKRLLMKRNHAP